MKLALKPRRSFITKSSRIYEASILDEDRFLDFFQNQDDYKIEGKNKYQNNGKSHEYNKQLVEKELLRVRASFKIRTTQLTFYMFNKIANHLAETLNIDKAGIDRLKLMA